VDSSAPVQRSALFFCKELQMTEQEVLNDWRLPEKVTMVNAPFNIGRNVTINDRHGDLVHRWNIYAAVKRIG
jgi:hypothetical protein